jgi:hypothetical protein
MRALERPAPARAPLPLESPAGLLPTQQLDRSRPPPPPLTPPASPVPNATPGSRVMLRASGSSGADQVGTI